MLPVRTQFPKDTSCTGICEPSSEPRTTAIATVEFRPRMDGSLQGSARVREYLALLRIALHR